MSELANLTVLVTGATDGLGRGVVRALAASVLANEPRLDVLVNNAGIGTNVPTLDRTESRDGIDLRFAVLAAVSGKYFDGVREAKPDAQAYDADARNQLRALSHKLVRRTMKG